MGQEINSTEFTLEDEKIFKSKLREETKVLKRWFDESLFDSEDIKCGLELEAWLCSKDFVPTPKSSEYLTKLNDPLVVPEISKFNFELNSEPFDFKGAVFSKLEDETLRLWKKCEKSAEDLSLKAMLIGTLPTLRDHMLTLDNLSAQKRYAVLNDQVMKFRDQKPIVLDFEGREEVHIEHNDVITECAATSLQIHYGVTQETAPKYYNASVVSSAFMGAVGANSPFFYGKELWDESRVPIFEQSVNLKSFRKLDGTFAKRVSIGNGYVKNSILELFIENLDGYPILLADHKDSDSNWLEHLRLHNGTVWRWNRPLIGLSNGAKPSLRLEFRVPSAGPTVKDSIANMAFQIALVEYLYDIEDLEQKIPFEVAEKNFYESCKYGLDAKVQWVDGEVYNIQDLLINQIIPHLSEKLLKKGIDESEAQKYIIDIIEPRILSGRNGANFQKSFIHYHGTRFQELLEKYYSYQVQNLPVHLWEI